ncbi:MAG: hypothetical protein ABIE74_04825 [Pseudomonadota bacterium]
MEYSDTHKAVFLFFQKALQRSEQLQFGNVLRGTALCAQELGFIRCQFDDGSDFLNREYRKESEFVLQIVWSLITQGLLMPGIPGNQNDSWPWLTITEYGSQCFQNGIVTPYDPDGYVANIKNDTNLSEKAELYLTEALHCFRSGCYIATMTMLGNVSETIILELMAAFSKKVSTYDSYERKVLKPNLIHKKWEGFSNYLQAHKGTILNDNGALRDAIEHHIPGIFLLIKTSRNSAGHPTGSKFTRTEVEGYFNLMPYYCRATYELIRYVTIRKNKL